MSLKPPKHSEKSWPKKRKTRAKKELLNYNLIVSEGTKTEPLYFEALKARINAKESNRIHLEIKGVGLNTTGLLDYAKMLVKSNPNGYSNVWLVYDKDDFPAERFNQMSEMCEALSKNDETEYHAIWSNQCIEIWFLLHFSYFQSDLHRAEYYPKLSVALKSVGGYQKNREDIFELLLPYLNDAIANAKKLAENNLGKTPSESSPGTMLHKMLKFFMPHL